MVLCKCSIRYSNSRVHKKSDPSFLSIDLTFFQICTGYIVCQVVEKYSEVGSQNKGANNETKINATEDSSGKYILQLAGLANAFAVVCTNSSYKLIGSTSTLVWNLSEPFIVAILKWKILSRSKSPVSLFGVAQIVLGVSFFHLYKDIRTSCVSSNIKYSVYSSKYPGHEK